MKVYHYKEGIRATKDFHLILENLSLYLKKHNNAIITTIDRNNSLVSLSDIDTILTDAQLVIYNPEMDILKAIDFTDKQSNLVNTFIARNNPNDLLVYSQQSSLGLPDGFKFKLKSSIYTPSEPHWSLDDYYIKRLLKTTFIDKFFFRGNVKNACRHAVDFLKNEDLFEGGESNSHYDIYFNELIQYKVGLSIPGIGELCFRDIEYMALGIPMMRFEYITQLDPPLIPNYHYISIDRIDTEEDKKYNGGVISREREADQRHINAYIKKFKEVKDNIEFLEFISKNARNYYDTYLHPSTRLNHIINLLEIK